MGRFWLDKVVPNKLYRSIIVDYFRLILEELNQTTDDDVQEKLEAAVEEALNDETYRKVKRMSYQSHIAEEVVTVKHFKL
jgi:uncharacterized protein (UPF0305 family)